MISRNNFRYIKNSLYLGTEYIGSVYRMDETCWKIRFYNGDISEDFYNITRAKENLIVLTLWERNKDLRYPKNTCDIATERGS